MPQLSIFGRGKFRTFDLEVQPVIGNVNPGESTSASVSIRPSSPGIGSIGLSASSTAKGGELPEGITVSFNPQIGVPPFSSIMNISTSKKTKPGAYSFLVVGIGEGTKQMQTYTLIVRSKKPRRERSYKTKKRKI